MDRSFIFSTFYDKPITSPFILRIQVGSSSVDACLDMFYSSTPYPPKEGRAKSPCDVSPWILPISFVKSLMQNWFPCSTNECQRIMAFWHSFFIFSLFLVLFLLILFLQIFLPLQPSKEKGAYGRVWSALTPNASSTRAFFCGNS